MAGINVRPGSSGDLPHRQAVGSGAAVTVFAVMAGETPLMTDLCFLPLVPRETRVALFCAVSTCEARIE